MANNTLKTTIEGILASNALIVVTLDGTFNSQTGAPVLSPRTRPDQRKKFLTEFCEKADASDIEKADSSLRSVVQQNVKGAVAAVQSGEYGVAITLIGYIQEAKEQLDQPRVYYRVKPNVDLRTAAEKRAAKKAENEAKRTERAASKAAKEAEKMAQKVEAQNAPETASKGTKAAKK